MCRAINRSAVAARSDGRRRYNRLSLRLAATALTIAGWTGPLRRNTPRDKMLQFRSGYSRIENPDGTREAKPYFGVGIYRAF